MSSERYHSSNRRDDEDDDDGLMVICDARSSNGEFTSFTRNLTAVTLSTVQ